jgi:NAD(P)H dehydrogenase (quinone)
MKATVIIAHPYPLSFNHAIFQAVCGSLKERSVFVYAHDLYREKFNPILTEDELGSDVSVDALVNQYSGELLESDLLIFIHPNWWGQPPAILKGYIDRIFRPPHCYDFPAGGEGGLPVGKLRGKCAIVLNTSNTAQEREENYFGDPLELIWKQCIFGFCGVDRFYRKNFSIVADSDEAQRIRWLHEAEALVDEALENIDN